MESKLHDSERMAMARKAVVQVQTGRKLVDRNCLTDLERVEADISGRRGRLLQSSEKFNREWM